MVADFPSAGNYEGEHNHGSIMLRDVALTSQLDIADIGGEHLDWNDQNFDFVEFLDPEATREPFEGSYFTLYSNSRHSTGAVNQIATIHLPNLFPDISIPVAPTFAARALIQRPRLEIRARRIATLLLHIMKSYSVMMLRDGSLPIFIHPHFI